MRLKSTRGMVANLVALAACVGCNGDHARAATPAAQPGISAGVALDHHLLVDQFGYLPDEMKVAIIRSPQVGFDKSDTFKPGNSYQVRRTDNGNVVFSGLPKAWRSGETQESSGDIGWSFDFSAVTAPGQYFVFDVSKQVRSPNFIIGSKVYAGALKAAMRTFYYQRSGIAKVQANAEACWVDSAAYVGANQDSEAHDVTDRSSVGKVKDLAGGWFDAGDTNKYVTFAVQPVHQLLTSYTSHTAAFGDDTNIPESGNGVPDVIDEVKWETDWIKKMQYADGSFALKVGDLDFVNASPPSSDKSARFYVPSCTSATIAASGMLAHAAFVFRQFPSLTSEADDLKARALSAWRNYQSTPQKQTQCDTGAVKSGNADLNSGDQGSLAVEAAVYLFSLTGDKSFDDFIAAHYSETQPYHDIGWSRYKADQGESLLFYTTLPMATAKLKQTILSDKARDVRAGNQVYGFNASDDLYRAFLHDGQYHWGSNNVRANYGNSNLDVTTHDVGIKDTSAYRARALELLHYFHGVNPLGIVYLTNMYSYGAARSVNEIFHVWYAHGTKWSDATTTECGPAPGYVPGGPNASAGNNGVPRINNAPRRPAGAKVI